MEEKDVDLITDIFISLYSLEIDSKKIDFFKENNGNLFYVLNPNYIIKLKDYLYYKDIKEQIKDYQSTKIRLKNDRKFIYLIKSLIISKIKIKFPEELKESKNINCNCAKYKSKRFKLTCDYFLKSTIIPQKYFNPIYNFLKKNNNKYQCNNITFWNNNNDAIVEINKSVIEVFKMDKNLIITPNYLTVFNVNDNYFYKFLYYQSFENFLEKENIHMQSENKNKDIIDLSKKSQKNFGKIIKLENLFKYNSNNLNKSLEAFDINQSLIIENLNKEKQKLKTQLKEKINEEKKLEDNLKKMKKNQNKLKKSIQEIEEIKPKYNKLKQENKIILSKRIELENINKNLQKTIEELENRLKQQIQINQNQNNINLMNQNQNNMNPIMNINQINMNPILNQNNINQNPNFNFMNNPNQIFMNPNQINQNFINNNQINQFQMIVPQSPIKVSKDISFNLINNYPITPKIGLVNIGSTFYMNAILQCFSQTRIMTEYFLNPENKEIIMKGLDNKPSELRLSKEYYNVVSNLWNINSIQHYEPKSFKNVLVSLNPLLEKKEDNSIKDMIIFFLEQIHKEINKAKVIDVNSHNLNINQYNREENLNNFINDFKIKNKSFISENFFIVNEKIQKCQNCKNNNTSNYICYNYNIQSCFIFPLEEVRKYRDTKLINNQTINMNMSKNNENNIVVSIEDCFEFNQKENENKIDCDLCKQNSEFINVNKILTLPNILIIILDRGKDNTCKIDFSFKEKINLTNYIFNSIEQYIYSIYGIITDMEQNEQSGNFIASCLSPIDGKWYQYNDENVREIINFEKEVLTNSKPYILFYQRNKQ